MVKKHILIVEDSEDSRVLLASAVRMLGHQVTIASDGSAALTATSEQKFDLIIMDWHMPGLDGFETATRIWASSGLNENVRIVVFTSSDTPAEVAACKSHGFVDVLSKAFNVQKLEDVLQRWLPSN